MDSGGVDDVLVMLADASTTKLDLCAQHISFTEVERISAVVQKNSSLTQLSLACNFLGIEGAPVVADLLQRNESLHYLDLHGCVLGDRGVASLAEALRTNATLQELVLDCNNITSLGAECLASALEVNHCLSTLSLAANRIGAAGAEYLLKALQQNTHLRAVNVAYNGIAQEDLKRLQAAMQKNNSPALPPTQPFLRLGSVAEEIRVRCHDVDAVTEFVHHHCEFIVTKYKRYIQTLSAQLQDQDQHHWRAEGDCRSQATSPPLLGSFSSRPGDAPSIWDPPATSSCWDPLLLFPAPPQLRLESMGMPMALGVTHEGWSQSMSQPKPKAMEWDPLLLFSSGPQVPANTSAVVCALADSPTSVEQAKDISVGSLKHLAAHQQSSSPNKPGKIAANSDGAKNDLDGQKDPTRISNLRRRLQRIQITKQKLLEACDPPPDHRQIAAIAAEADIVQEIEQYEKFGTWAPAPTPKPPKAKRSKRNGTAKAR